MRLSMLGFLEVVEAHGVDTADRLRAAGYADNVIMAKAEKAARRGYTTYGVIADRCWLTSEGRAFLATYRNTVTPGGNA